MWHRIIGATAAICVTLAASGTADAAVRKDGSLYVSEADLLTAFPISNSDIITGMLPLRNNELVGAANYPTPIRSMSPGIGADACDQPLANPQPQEEGFHGATPDPTGGGLTDGAAGAQPVESVLEDFAYPAAVFQYELPAATDIGEIRVYVANDWAGGRDGRIFQDYDIEISVDSNGSANHVFTPLATEVTANAQICATPPFGDGYSPNVNDGSQVPLLGASLTRVFDDANPVLATGVTSIRFTFYAVSNTDTAFFDRWLGPVGCALPPGENPATYWDAEDFDGFKRAFESCIVREIDVLAARVDPFEICDNTIDDDGDGAIDALDPDCFGGRESCPPENCSDGMDNDGNTLTDCDDPDCRDEPSCNVEICDDDLDNDGDGSIDCDDVEDCADFFPDCVCNDPVFDTDGDLDVDHEDFGFFQGCMTGLGDPGGIFGTLPVACHCLDVTGIGDVPDDAIAQDDYGMFEQCATGPAVPAAASCDDPPF
jgi:hypothetical protein